MSNLNNIKLGNRVRDVITGYEGIATQRTDFMNGNTQFSVTSQAVDGKYPSDGISLDYHTLEVIDKAFEDKSMTPTFTSKVVLGQMVECVVTGALGIATHKTTYMNGCSSYLVCEKVLNAQTGQRQIIEDWIDQTKLKVVSDGVVNQVEKVALDKQGKAPGGAPMRNIPRG